MKPLFRRAPAGLLAALLASFAIASLPGCQVPWIKKNKNEEIVRRVDDLEPDVEFVGDLTRGWGLGYSKIEAVAVITRLRGTGSDPPANDRRETLREEMKTNGVKDPDAVLALDNTSMAYVKVFLPPGVKKGDRADVIVDSPPRSETTSLRDGWLMQTRLRPVEALGNRLRQGKVLGVAGGPVVVDAVFQGQDDQVNLVRGRVLGGAESLVDRPIGLVVIGDNHSIMTSTHVAAAINRRFHAFDHGKKVGVAEPKDDDYIELKISPKYEHNLGRYLRVVQSVAVHEAPERRVERLGRLEGLLLEPVSSARAALRLEAIGKEAAPVLKNGLQSPDPEVRFYSAEALAYLEEPDAVPALAEAAHKSRAFRWHALAALSVMDDPAAYHGLTELLHSESSETRMGAVRAIRTRRPEDPLVRGDKLGHPQAPTVRLTRIASHGEPLVHFMRYREPEVTIFARDLQLQAPYSLFAGREIVVKSEGPDRVKLSRFVPGEEERRMECSARLDDVVRAIVAIGGGYADVMQAVKEAQNSGALAARVEVNSLPAANREYHRDDSSSEISDDVAVSSTPFPGLFADPAGDERRSPRDNAPDWEFGEDEESPGFWGRMKGWLTPW
ncbi:MAG: flagellar basal body P-ring protein FlgI [Planctomycetes bacterium]|nr:flagellar basal body P-ring protein FlgI [Planctomycetota bacterium]